MIAAELLEAHYGPDGPVAAAFAWLILVVEKRDLAAAWPKTDPNLRLVFARKFVNANRDHLALQSEPRGALADALAAAEPTHRLWPTFAHVETRGFAQSPVFGGFDQETWGAGSEPRPVAPGLEAVIFLRKPVRGPMMVASETPPDAVVLMRHVDGEWLVAGFTDELPTPPEVE